MPDSKEISALTTAEQTSANDLFETSIPNAMTETGYISRKNTLNTLATFILNTLQFSTLATTAKNIIPAINEAAQSGGGASVIQLTMAQYTALPSTDKMNGSIYKITDKALIYCLDEEYHALKEIASVDYAQLTSDEQNNGTLYILTDGIPPSETVTGSDIIPFIDIDDSNKPKSTTAAAVAGLATKILSFGDTKSSDQTTTNTLLVLSSQSFTLDYDMTIGCVFSGVMKTSRYTSSLCLVIDNNIAVGWATNSTDFTCVTGFHSQTLTAGSHTIGIGIVAQDSGTTATLKSYNRFGGLLVGGI